MTGYRTHAAALRVSRRATATPCAVELCDGTWAACLDDTVDSSGTRRSWYALPRNACVSGADLSVMRG